MERCSDGATLASAIIGERELSSITLPSEVYQELAKFVELFDDQLKPLGDAKQPAPDHLEDVRRALSTLYFEPLHERTILMAIAAQGGASVVVLLPREMVEFEPPRPGFTADHAARVRETRRAAPLQEFGFPSTVPGTIGQAVPTNRRNAAPECKTPHTVFAATFAFRIRTSRPTKARTKSSLAGEVTINFGHRRVFQLMMR